MICHLPLHADTDVDVLGDTSYDSRIVRAACAERGYEWIFPANPEHDYEGTRGQ